MKSLEDGMSFFQHLVQLRHKTGIICGNPQSGKSKYCSELARLGSLDYVDILADLLPNLPEPLGAYDHASLIRYIEMTTIDTMPGLILDDVEPLFSTFGKERTRAFFIAFSRLEIRRPVIVVTHLNAMLGTSFTSDRVMHLTAGKVN